MSTRHTRYAGQPASLLLLLCIAWTGCDGCGACGDGDHVAELLTSEAQVDRDFAAKVGDWSTAGQGALFDVGDGLRTGPGASAELRLFPDGRMRVQSDATVRFLDTPPGQQGQQLSIEGGDVEIEAGALQLGVDTAFGITRLGKGSRLRVRGEGDAQRLSLLAGAAEISQNGQARALEVGEGLVLQGGVATIEVEPAAASAPAPVAADAGVPEPGVPVDAGVPAVADAGAEQTAADRRAYGRIDVASGPPGLRMAAGESATIHDPRPPSLVQVSLAGCTEGGVVEVARSGRRYNHYRARGEGSAVLRLDRGSYRYRVRCMRDGRLTRRPSAQGRLRVVRDGGRRRLPRKPPAVSVDADGRRYSVRYSNLLPQITLRWRRPPNGSPQTLHLRLQGGGKRSMRANVSGVRFASGDIPEGTHSFYFEAGGRKSKKGTLDIVFDNTARTAYLSSPADGSVVAGSKVHVAGGALPGSKVSVDGVPVKMRGKGRFEADAVVPAGRGAVALRVQHRRGVHYYLRHVATP